MAEHARLLAVVALAWMVVAIGTSAQAGVWTYGFNSFPISTVGDYTTDWGHSSQVLTTEGWSIQGSSTDTRTRGEVFQYDANTRGIQTTWYNTSTRGYVKARISYAQGGGQGTLATITDLGTAPLVKYTWNTKTGTDGGKSQGVQWRVSVNEGTTARLDLGIPLATRVTSNPGPAWQFTTPAGTYTASRSFNTSEQLLIEMAVDLVHSTATVYFNGEADAGLTDVSVAGADLRLAKDIYMDLHGGNLIGLKVETLPEPATIAVLAVGVLCLRRRNPR